MIPGWNNSMDVYPEPDHTLWPLNQEQKDAASSVKEFLCFRGRDSSVVTWTSMAHFQFINSCVFGSIIKSRSPRNGMAKAVLHLVALSRWTQDLGMMGWGDLGQSRTGEEWS